MNARMPPSPGMREPSTNAITAHLAATFAGFPVYVHTIEHADGVVLVDTGMIDSTPELDEEGAPEPMPQNIPRDVVCVINTHLHFDHCGGNEFFPGATFLVQRPELEAARRPGFVPGYSPSPIDFEHPLDYQPIDGEHDVFGDGTVILIPTYGHTPGHQSLLVRAGKGTQLVAASDACYTRENMDRDVLPKILWNPSVMRDSLAALRKLRDGAGATMFYGHDPEQWAATPRAPAPVI